MDPRFIWTLKNLFRNLRIQSCLNISVRISWFFSKSSRNQFQTKNSYRLWQTCRMLLFVVVSLSHIRTLVRGFSSGFTPHTPMSNMTSHFEWFWLVHLTCVGRVKIYGEPGPGPLTMGEDLFEKRGRRLFFNFRNIKYATTRYHSYKCCDISYKQGEMLTRAVYRKQS